MKIGSIYTTSELDKDIVLQFVGKNKTLGSIARIGRISAGNDICSSISTLFVVGFPIGTAISSGYLRLIGRCAIPEQLCNIKFKWPNRRIATHEIVSWSILDNDKQLIRPSLTPEERDYPLAYIIDIAKLEELVRTGWDGITPII